MRSPELRLRDEMTKTGRRRTRAVKTCYPSCSSVSGRTVRERFGEVENRLFSHECAISRRDKGAIGGLEGREYGSSSRRCISMVRCGWPSLAAQVPTMRCSSGAASYRYRTGVPSHLREKQFQHFTNGVCCVDRVWTDALILLRILLYIHECTLAACCVQS